MKTIDWILIALIVGLYLTVFLSDDNHAYEAQIEQLERQLEQKEAEYNELQNKLYDLGQQLVKDSAYVAGATRPQVDSLFSDYFELRHPKVLHLRTGEGNTDRPSEHTH